MNRHSSDTHPTGNRQATDTIKKDKKEEKEEKKRAQLSPLFLFWQREDNQRTVKRHDENQHEEKIDRILFLR